MDAIGLPQDTDSRKTAVAASWQRSGFARRGRAWHTGIELGLTAAQRVMLMALSDAADKHDEINWTTEAQIHVSGLPRRTAERACGHYASKACLD